MDLEKKLLKLFDYQRFEKEKSLQRVINEVEQKYDNEIVALADVSLSFASGGRKIDSENIKEGKDDPEQPK